MILINEMCEDLYYELLSYYFKGDYEKLKNYKIITTDNGNKHFAVYYIKEFFDTLNIKQNTFGIFDEKYNFKIDSIIHSEVINHK